MIIALPHRSLVRFGKDDAAPFLNDLITASIPESAEDGLRPAALLTRKAASCLICWYPVMAMISLLNLTATALIFS